MDVVLGDHRQLVVDDMRQRVDVETPCGDVRGDQDRGPAGLEVGQRADSLGLALVAMNRGGGDSVTFQLLGQPARAVLGPGEDQRLADPTSRDQVAEQLALALAVHRVDKLADQLGDLIARGHLNLGRVVQDARRKASDLLGEGG